ncbi:MAG: transcriptional activator NhaR [Thermoguttaceae bacterium]|jgi:LysR family transcriptional activator of nhaA|nr:transcriptional activator NhaR [Thermoguttaceae bacterium]
MECLNFHHLRYFWTVAREGSIRRACEKLLVSQPTVSTQMRQLEKSLGEKLFARVGRNLVLTDAGRTVYRYADEIFALGQQIPDAIRGKSSLHELKLVVGVADVLSKLIAYRLLEPALRLSEPVYFICRDGRAEDLLADLAVHRLDLVLSDAPVTPTIHVRAFNHLLGECGISICGTAVLAKRYRRNFPQSLDGAPMLLPAENTTLRQVLEQWFHAEAIRPAAVAEFEDSSLLKVFGQAGLGLFPVPTAIEDEVQRQYRVRIAGRIESARTQFYAISTERKLRHPAVKAISEAAKDGLFAGTG